MKKKMKIFQAVTVSIRRDRELQFLGLYILAAVVMSGKMYKLKKCSNRCRRMLIVTPAICQHLARLRLWIGKP